MRVLFDDAIDPGVFSSTAEAGLGTTDHRIVERIRASLLMVPVVVVTVTDEHSGQNGRVELELMPTARPIRGSLAPYVGNGEPMKVRLGPSSSGYSMVRSAQTELVGKRMNLCWARFAEGAEAVEHWHALSDTPKMRLAIAKAAAIVNFD
jgi:hypothetical protein